MSRGDSKKNKFIGPIWSKVLYFRKKRVFIKYAQLAFLFNDDTFWSFKVSKKSLVWILKTMSANLWAKAEVKRVVSKPPWWSLSFTYYALSSLKFSEKSLWWILRLLYLRFRTYNGIKWHTFTSVRISGKYSQLHFCFLTVTYHSKFQKIFPLDSSKKAG